MMARLASLLGPLLSSESIAALESSGIRTVIEFITEDPTGLSKKTGISAKNIVQVRRIVLAQYAAFPVTAADLVNETNRALLPTGTHCSTHMVYIIILQLRLYKRSIDNLLDGGVMTGELLEITGPSTSGKTQLCMTLSAHIAARTSSTVMFIDSGGSMFASRLSQIIDHCKTDDEGTADVLERIKICRLHDMFEFLAFIWDLKEKIASQIDGFHSCLHALVLDSVTPLIAPQLGGLQSEGHSLMCQLVLALRLLATEHSVAVVLTNNMVSGGGVGPRVKPALGQTWSSVPSTRLQLDCPQQGSRTATLTKSTRQKTGLSCLFSITEAGCITTA